MSDWNDKLIAEFRANGGTVGGNWEGKPLLLLHTTGAKSGEPRVHPMMYMAVDEGWTVFASYAGLDVNPAWFHNLRADPAVSIELGVDGSVETIEVKARVLTPEEREPIWEEQKRRYPGFAGYEKKTDRVIPVVLLTCR